MEKETLFLDRLSSLHESIITHILSFLPTIEAVRTCILSKNWRDTWKYVPALDFTLDDSSVDFVDRVLARRFASDVTRFRLFSRSCHRRDRIASWVHYAIQHNVRDVVDLPDGGDIGFLDELLNSQSLESLDLSPMIVRPFSNSVCLSKLLVLSLNIMQQHSDGSLEKFISNCPALVDLRMIGVFRGLNISAPILKSLKLVSSETFKLELSCPRLEHFNLSVGKNRGNWSYNCSLPSLVKTLIYSADDRLLYQILVSLHNATDIGLSIPKFKFSRGLLLENYKKCLPTLNNLKCLHLCSCFHDDDHIESLLCLLSNTPNVKFLSIWEMKCDCVHRSNTWTSRKLCVELLHLLEKVDIWSCIKNGGHNMVEFVRFLSINVFAWKRVKKKIYIRSAASPLLDIHDFA